MTNIRTARATYKVVKIELVKGRIVILARTDKGTTRALTRKDVTTARWYAALSDWAAGQRKARRTV